MKNNKNKNTEINLIITYDNPDMDKSLIYEENINKSGIYRWNNLINGKSYIGSYISLGVRFSIYYSYRAMNKKLSNGSSAIYRAILKYGYSNFSLDIL